jgi:hypothetical protein
VFLLYVADCYCREQQDHDAAPPNEPANEDDEYEVRGDVLVLLMTSKGGGRR